MQRDPIFFGGGQANLYAYVNNDPVNFGDPNGKMGPWLLLGIGGLAWCSLYELGDAWIDSIRFGAVKNYLESLQKEVQRLLEIEEMARRRCDHDTAVEAAALRQKVFVEIGNLEGDLGGMGTGADDLAMAVFCGALEAALLKKVF